jgi:hypothetical protein
MNTIQRILRIFKIIFSKGLSLHFLFLVVTLLHYMDAMTSDMNLFISSTKWRSAKSEIPVIYRCAIKYLYEFDTL